MTAKAYTTEALVQAELGAPLTPEQAADFDARLGQVVASIDLYTARAWLTGTPVVESFYATGTEAPIRLRAAPVASVASVTGRAGLGSPEETLTQGTDWELADPVLGIVRFAWPCPPYDIMIERSYWPRRYDRVRVTYTPADATSMLSSTALVVQRAATLLMATDYTAAAAGGFDPSTLKSYSIPGDLEVTFRDGATGQADGLTSEARALLAPLRYNGGLVLA